LINQAKLVKRGCPWLCTVTVTWMRRCRLFNLLDCAGGLQADMLRSGGPQDAHAQVGQERHHQPGNPHSG
jgi:hypothetical protein